MPTRLPARRPCWLFCCVTLAAAVAFPPPVLGQKYVEIAAPATTDSSSSKKISVRMWVVELKTDKLRSLGFDLSQITSRGSAVTSPLSTAGDVAIAVTSMKDAAGFEGFLKALEQNNLARTRAEPTIVTLSGRKASLAIGEQLQLEATPTALDDQRVELQYRIEVGSEAQASQSAHLVTASTVQVDVGKPCVISHSRGSSRSADGKIRPTETLVLVQADYFSPPDAGAAQR
jgi:hypothetical protein